MINQVVVVIALIYLLISLIRLFSARERKIDHELAHLYDAANEEFCRSLGGLLQPGYLNGNRIQALKNGKEIFPSMLAAIRGAKKTINFETYIYWSGKIGEEFANAMCERARAGVQVHVLLDWVGSLLIDKKVLNQLKTSGVQVERYHPPTLFRFSQTNHRSHRKILVVDGTSAFTGGVGIADQWLGNAEDESHWRDSHFRFEGPVVAQIQSAFLDNWLKVRPSVLHGNDYFPKLESCGDSSAQVCRSSPEEGSNSARLMYFLAIAAASKSIRLASAYFVPDSLAIKMLVAARKRGVKIQIIVPGEKIDVSVVRRASRASWGALLEAGVEIFEFQPTMFHVKVLVIDEVWTSVGSTNFDNRSFRMNDEVNLNLYDSSLAAEQVRWFEEDLARARQITFDEWRSRPLTEKLKEFSAGLLAKGL